MAAGKPKIFESGAASVLANAKAQWDLAGNQFAFILLDTAWTPDASLDTYSQLTNECIDADYAPIGVTTRTINEVAGVTYLDADDAAFGDPKTISARYLVCVQGDYTALAGTDSLVFFVDLNTSGANVSTITAAFTVVADALGWLSITETA